MKNLLFCLLFAGCWLVSGSAVAQRKAITGTITDAVLGETVPGVTILEKGRNNGTITNTRGVFNLLVADEATIVVQAIGMVTQEIVVGNQATIDVVLKADNKLLNEVVVTAVAIQREARSLGYAVQTVKSDELNRVPTQNALTALQGKTAGLQITQSGGNPGAPVNVILRGTRSLGNNNQPLFVIDGIPIDNSQQNTPTNSFATSGLTTNRATDINPEDVETITVLKGPAAAVLYGSRAANGAIIITTKTGKDAASRGKKAEITVNSSVTFDEVLRLPKFQNANGQGNLSGTTFLIDPSIVSSWGPAMDGRTFKNLYGQDQTYSPQPDNVKDILKTGITRSIGLSVGGGNETLNYLLAYSNLNQTGVVPNTDNVRNILRFNATAKLTSKLTSSAGITYTISGGNRLPQGTSPNARNGLSAIYQLVPRSMPTSILRDPSLYYLNYNSNRDDLTQNYPLISGNGNNPYWERETSINRDKVNRILGFAQLNYDLLTDLKATFRIGTDFYSDQRTFYVPPGTNFVSGTYGQFGGLAESRFFTQELTTDFLLTYSKKFSKDFGITAIAGHNIRQRKTDGLYTDGFGQLIPGFVNITGFANQFTPVQSSSVRRLWGIYGDVQLAFRDYLYLGITGRNDNSSTLPVNNRSYFYPGITAGFVFSEGIKSLKDSKILDYGKLRLNYASVGNDANPYLLQQTYELPNVNQFNPFPFNGTVPGYTLSNTVINPDLKPEQTTSVEAGLELRLFKNRIGLDFSYYDALSSNQIVSNLPLSSATGFNSRIVNAGKVRNKGIEILLTGSPLRSARGLNWDISLNFTRNRNVVEELDPQIGDFFTIQGSGGNAPALVARKGAAYGDLLGNGYTYTADGKLKIGANGIPFNDALGTTVVGNIQPDWLAGVTNTFSYRGFSFNMLWDFKKGGSVFSTTYRNMTTFGQGYWTTFDDKGVDGRTTGDGNTARTFIVDGVRETSPGVFAPNTVPVTVYNYWRILGGNPGNINHEAFIFDGSWIRLRDASISYRVPRNIVQKTPFGKIELSVIGRNLFLYTPNIPYNNFDPETSSNGAGNAQGFENGGISTKSYGASLRITL